MKMPLDVSFEFVFTFKGNLVFHYAFEMLKD